MTRPWIGIPTKYQSDHESFGQNRRYLEAILAAGGLPLMIPTVSDASVARQYAERAHGLLLPGSPTDIDPALYGSAPHAKLGKPYPERDATDLALLEFADRAGMPLVGICFGAQSLNVYRGGTLIQDIPAVVPGALRHDAADPSPDGPARHTVRLADGTLLAGWSAVRQPEVNSYHHQCIERPGRNLRIAATAPDGVIEAVEDTEGKFFLGVQWHPERSWTTDAFACELFASLVRRACQFQSETHSV